MIGIARKAGASIRRHPALTAANVVIAAVALWMLIHPTEGDARLKIGDVVLYACVAAGVLFMAVYAATARWYRSLEGWNIMALAASLTASLLLSASARIFGTDYWGRHEIRIIVLAVLLGTLIQRISWLYTVQVQRRRGGRRGPLPARGPVERSSLEAHPPDSDHSA